MHWAADKRKLLPKDAAGVCREATAALHEAIAQLEAATKSFESQGQAR